MSRNFDTLHQLKARGFLLKSGNNTPQKGFDKEAGVKKFISNPVKEAQKAQRKAEKENAALRNEMNDVKGELASIKNMLGTLIEQTSKMQVVTPQQAQEQVVKVQKAAERVETAQDRFIKLDSNKELKTHTVIPDRVTHSTGDNKAKSTIQRLKNLNKKG